MTEPAPADDDQRRARREVILARPPRHRTVGRSAVLRQSLVVVYARALRTEPEAGE